MVRGSRTFLGFAKVGRRFEITDEIVQKEGHTPGILPPAFYYKQWDGRAFLNSSFVGLCGPREISKEEISPQQSILSQRKDPDHYLEITEVGSLFAAVRLYRGWDFGAHAKLREPCDASEQGEYLEETDRTLESFSIDSLAARL